MRVFSVTGISGSGKTTTIEKIIEELKTRNYTVGSVKEIHFEGFSIDEEGTNTYRHSQVGAEPVTARGYEETDLLFKKRLSLKKIFSFYQHDYLVLEGVEKDYIPRVITAHNKNELKEQLNGSGPVFAISGRIAGKIDNFQKIPAFNPLTEPAALTDYVEEKVFSRLPGFSKKCCGDCGYSCAELAGLIISGQMERSDCCLQNKAVSLTIGRHEIEMVEFVQKVLKNTVLGVVSELDGFQKGKKIKIEIGKQYET